MTARAKVLSDRTIGREETLGRAGGFGSLHTPLPLACRLVRVLGAIIAIPMLPMLDSWQYLALGGSVALQSISDDHARDVGEPFAQFAEELLCCLLIAPALYQAIQHVAVLIHHPPQIVMLALDGEYHFVDVPLVTVSRTAAPELIGVLLTELTSPLANRLIRHSNATFTQELFHIPEAQTESEV